jgi:ABC-type branched-subunit amino acid transport system ATPase component
MSAAALHASDVSISFGGVQALDRASVKVTPGGIIGLIGRNGSGKSTLFNCITGFLKPSTGQILIDGRDIASEAPHQIVRAGVARTFQTPRIDFRTTVRQAVLCGLFPTVKRQLVSAVLCLPGARREERELQRRADAVIRELDMQSLADTEIGRLSMGRVRMVEVARAIAANATYLLLDEPAAGLSRDEQEVLAREIRKLASRGIGVLLVEHNFALIRLLCDSVTVLDSGRVLFEGTPAQVARDEQVLRVYLGAAAETSAVAVVPSHREA